MKREDLKALGLDDETITKVLDAHHKEMDPVKEQLEAETTKNKTLETDLSTQKAEIEKLSKSTGTLEEKNAEIQKLTTKAAELEEARKKEVKELTEKLDSAEFDKYLDVALSSNKAKRRAAVVAELDLETLRKSTNRQADIDAAVKALVENEETSFLFGEPEAQPTGKKTTFPSTTKKETGGDDDAAMRAAMGLPLVGKEE